MGKFCFYILKDLNKEPIYTITNSKINNRLEAAKFFASSKNLNLSDFNEIYGVKEL